MRKDLRISTAVLFGILLAFTVCAPVVSASEKDMPEMDMKKGSMPEMDKDMAGMEGMPDMDEATMAKMMEYGAVSEHHKVLDFFVGDWNYTMKWWMAPGTEPQESDGVGNVDSIMGGRFIEQYFSGTAMGQPFEGRGTMGYDNLKKHYVSTWIDNMSTGIMKSTGQYDAATKTLTENGSHTCPLSESGEKSFKAVIKIIDDNTYTYETYTTDATGQEFKSMTITYTREL